MFDKPSSTISFNPLSSIANNCKQILYVEFKIVGNSGKTDILLVFLLTAVVARQDV